MWKRIRKLYKLNHRNKTSLKDTNDSCKQVHSTNIFNSDNNNNNRDSAIDIDFEKTEKISATESRAAVETPTDNDDRINGRTSPIPYKTTTRTTTTSAPPPSPQSTTVAGVKHTTESTDTKTDTHNQETIYPTPPTIKAKKANRLRKHFMKKPKDTVKDTNNNNLFHHGILKGSTSSVAKPHSFSKSTGDLRDRSQSTPSLVPRRESRQSVISQLDDYIKHLKQSIDEGNIAYAPNRLCCAQLLRTVYMRREQQCQYESLHNNNNNNSSSSNHHHHHSRHLHKNRSKRHSLIPISPNRESAPEFSWHSTNHSNFKSLQDLRNNNMSFDSTSSACQSPCTKVKWHQGSPETSECSSLSGQENSIKEDKHPHSFPHRTRNESMFINNNNSDSFYESDYSLNYNEDDAENSSLSNEVNSSDNSTYRYRAKNRHKSTESLNGKLSKSGHRKSVPLFPQALDIDIY